MNRTIKFRGKRDGTGEWVYGDLLTNNGNPIIVSQVNRDYISRSYVNDESVGGGTHWAIETPAYLVDPSTVGQFTGRHDHSTAFAPTETKGVEVYSGDIVAAHFYYMNELIQCNMEVYFNDDELQWKLRTDKHDVPMYECDYMHVKGNIHDNPELLK